MDRNSPFVKLYRKFWWAVVYTVRYIIIFFYLLIISLAMLLIVLILSVGQLNENRRNHGGKVLTRHWLLIAERITIRPIPDMFLVSGSIFLCKTDLLHWALFHGTVLRTIGWQELPPCVPFSSLQNHFCTERFHSTRCSYLSIQIAGDIWIFNRCNDW